MFYSGIIPPPDIIPTDYNLSTGCDPVVTIPDTGIEVGQLTLCDVDYDINMEFADRATLLTFLNTSFLHSFGLEGSFSIVDDELIYSTADDCDGTCCISLMDALLTEDGIDIYTEDGFKTYRE